MKRILLFLALVPFSLHAQVTLQMWTEHYGTTNGEQLGKYVTGMTPSTGLPYRAAVSKVGSTGVYRLNSPSDTSAQLRFLGENLLTGDLNNDGYKDVVVGKTVNGYDTIFVYWGTITGIDTLNPLRIAGENQFDNFGPRIIADANNDGYRDLIVAAAGFPAPLGFGKVYFFLGPSISSTPNGVLIGDTVGARLGAVVIGDLTNDGLNDLILGGYSVTGPQSQWHKYLNINFALSPDSIPLQRSVHLTSSFSATSGLSSFDVNGDGRDDLLWAIQDSQDTRINVHFGRTNFDSIPDLQLQNPGVGTFGSVIMNSGDMNGDGFNDVVVGCPRASMISGVVLVYGGGPNIDRFVDAAVSRGSAGDFGWSVGAMGDLTGDGLADIIVGAPRDPFFPPQQFEKGYWGVFKGDSTIRVTSVNESKNLPGVFVLHQVYPNPFNPATTIGYELRTSAFVTVEVYDLLGKLVASLVREVKAPGEYTAMFDGSRHASGVYLYRMTVRTAGGKVFTTTKKMILLSELDRENQPDEERLMFLRANDELMAAQTTDGFFDCLLYAPVQQPDTILYLKDGTIYFYDKDITRLKALGILP